MKIKQTIFYAMALLFISAQSFASAPSGPQVPQPGKIYYTVRNNTDYPVNLYQGCIDRNYEVVDIEGVDPQRLHTLIQPHDSQLIEYPLPGISAEEFIKMGKSGALSKCEKLQMRFVVDTPEGEFNGNANWATPYTYPIIVIEPKGRAFILN